MAQDAVVVMTTGGTIAMRDEGQGAVPALSGAELVGAPPPDLQDLALRVVEFANVPSNHLTVGALWALRERVVEALREPAVCGVVVTHGTDTLEETAYLLDCTLPSPKPVVVTGAMIAAGEPGYEGLRNLWASVRVVRSPEARGRGTMVVLSDEIHAARYVTKLSGHHLPGFGSPNWGPMGRLFDGRIVWGWSLPHPPLHSERLDPDVHLLTVATGASDLLLRHLIERRVSGIVIEGIGAGRVPPDWLPSIQAAIAQGIAVVVASRTVGGYTSDPYGYPGSFSDLARMGVIPAQGLTGPKARIRLMVALGKEQSMGRQPYSESGDAGSVADSAEGDMMP